MKPAYIALGCLFFLLITKVACGRNKSEPQPTLIGGRAVKPGEYPEVVRIKAGRAQCTAAVVGPRVILTAAHCTQSDGQIEPVSQSDVYEVQVNQHVYTARCTLPPQPKHLDLALCKTDRVIDVKYAILSSEGPSLNEVITLIGYGCTEPGGYGGNDGVLRVGEAPVTQVDKSDYPNFHTRGQSALCFGDSGGPAFKKIEDPKGEDHFIYGVNSKGDIRVTSILAAVYHDQAVSFARSFERSKKVSICGLSLDCSNDPIPPKKCSSELEGLVEATEKIGRCLAN